MNSFGNVRSGWRCLLPVFTWSVSGGVLLGLMVLSASFVFLAETGYAQHKSNAKSDRKCVTCHRRLSFKEAPPVGEEWQVHVVANEFIQASHAELGCQTCHKDILKTPHRKNVERGVDCVGCHRRHPEFILRDASGESVLKSEQPLSNRMTCGHCHDTDYIESTSDHAAAGMDQLFGEDRPVPWQAGPGYFGGWDPIRYDADVLDASGNVDPDAWLTRYGIHHVGGGPVGDRVEMNCLMCHSDITDQRARGEALSQGQFEWANSIALVDREILESSDGKWHWNEDMFQEDGKLKIGLMNISSPDAQICAQCHGQASNDASVPLVMECDHNCRRLTERTGQIIAPHPINDSGLNIAPKGENDHPLDVHAERGLECVNCHYSLNNPIYYRPPAEDRPDFIYFDPRRPGRSEFLDRPMHQFAKGLAIHGLASEQTIDTLRTCESCHEVGTAHDWLPYPSRHFESLACEACHIPWVYGPALQAIDWTMLGSDGEPLTQYRGLSGDLLAEDSIIDGFRPILLPRIRDEEKQRLAPFNLVTSWFWTTDEPSRPVTRQELKTALLRDGDHHPDLVAAFDRDGNGKLEGDELHLVSPEQQEIVKQLLSDSGLQNLSVGSEVLPFPINHNVVSGKWATRDCANCHTRESALKAGFLLSTYQPGGQPPTSAGYSSVAYSGSLAETEDGGVAGVPDPSIAGFYILGADRIGWIDLLGILMFVGTLLGVAGHATLRIIAHRRIETTEEVHELKRVYMYDVYERLWHWLQAIMIMYLIFTGLVIHNPHLFSSLNFPLMVDSHNVFGFVLLINAGLALFYNLASGRFKQYMPEPKDFFARSLMQVAYYTRGIFKGEPHPFEKTKHKRLNPLQEITYFGILNILLPLQVITGLMVWWGMKNWPIMFTSLGGLPVLGPAHTLIAWVFASFIVMHIYLVTASGHTPMAATKSMITGWEDVHKRPEKAVDVAAEAAEEES